MATGYFEDGWAPSGARKTGGRKYIGTPGFGGSWVDEYVWETDEDKKNNYVNAAIGRAASAVSSAQSGVDAILGRQGDIDASIAAMRGDAGRMEGLADDLGGMGRSMFDSGTKVTEQALETLGTGLGFIRMDESASPLVAEAIRLYGEFDPDRYVAGAAQDMQSQFDNSQKQAQRQLSRMGVSPTSGAAAALNNLRDRALAVARASAMTRARERGKTEQMGAFQSLLANNANTFLQTGGQLASIGTSMRSAGASALGNAGNLLGDAGRLHGAAGSLSLDFGRGLAGAYNALAGTQLSAANVSLGAAGKYGVGGSARGGGSVISTPAPDDNWDNWKNTGHSETWNKNHNPDFLDLLNNGAPSHPNPAG